MNTDEFVRTQQSLELMAVLAIHLSSSVFICV
jgi:hypothetical protein